MNKTLIVTGSIILGLIFIGLAILYWTTPAESLPSFLPGFQAGSAHIHLKHAIASLLVGLALFVFAWFKSASAR